MRLLTVEDEVRLASALQRGLAGEVCIVDLAHTGSDGLHATQETTYDAVSKADILHHVWDANYEGDANVVEVYVGYLRRKIGTPFGRQSVQTVRGAGYRLAAETG